MDAILSSARRCARNAVWPCIARAATAAQFPEPIFLVSPPRSGSNFLFECLIQFGEIFHYGIEANEPWRRAIRPVADESFHDAVCASDLTDAARAGMYRDYYRGAVLCGVKRHPERIRPGHVPGRRPIRYLDKTIANCFRLDALQALFPSARFVFLRRDPRPTISSMMRGWGQPKFRHRFATPPLQRATGGTLHEWSYPAPPGWFDRRFDSLAAVCAWSWAQHMRASLAFEQRRDVDGILVRYEDLLDDLPGRIGGLADALRLELTGSVRAYLEDPPLSRTTQTRPHPDKWKEDREELSAAWSSIREVAEDAGYTDAP